MKHPFSVLEPEYLALLARMTGTRQAEVDRTAHRLLSYIPAHYQGISEDTGVPLIWFATTFEREAGSNFRLYFGNGDPLSKRTTHVPAGRGPFRTWRDGTIDALGVDKIAETKNWTWPLACYKWELWNGFGPRDYHGIHTGYLWSRTNNYSAGKYFADGKWSGTEVDKQLGTVPVARRMVELDPSLEIPGWPGTKALPLPSPPAQTGLPFGGDAVALQKALNRLGVAPPLVVDGNYGRATRRAVEAFQTMHGLEVDGLAGPLTWAAVDAASA